MPPVRRPSTQWRSGSVSSSTSGAPGIFQDGSGVAGPSGLNNVVIPPPPLATDSSGISSSAIGNPHPKWIDSPYNVANKQLKFTGSILRPSSSSTTHTITDFPPVNNNQGPSANMEPPQPSLQLDSDTLEQINIQRASSRPPTACHDSQTLNQLLPPKRDLPFSKPAAKKPCTSRKQTDKVSVEKNSIGMILLERIVLVMFVLLTNNLNELQTSSKPSLSHHHPQIRSKPKLLLKLQIPQKRTRESIAAFLLSHS